eukprot:TRINITY_DN1392_c0_g1_i1.p2 TRINITY_DN1392_c0_g1~~TRINITY_DN1392_c0_g1_i1.p2  ORF type:complete len:157 (-),score=48.18 TRINITY_DN1392_c0_g1_i1:498-968(-)
MSLSEEDTTGAPISLAFLEKQLLESFQNLFREELSSDEEVLGVFSDFAYRAVRSCILGESLLEKEELLLYRLVEARFNDQYSKYLERTLFYRRQVLSEGSIPPSSHSSPTSPSPNSPSHPCAIPPLRDFARERAILSQAVVLESLLSSKSYGRRDH